MIVRMKHLDVLCVAAEREKTLERLRSLGAVQLDLAPAGSAACQDAEGALADADRAVQLIRKARTGNEECAVRPHTVAEVLALAADRDTLSEEAERLSREVRRIEPYGDFDPALARKLLSRGIDLSDRLPAVLPEMRLGRLKEKLARVENRIRIDTLKIAQCDERILLSDMTALRDRVAFAAARARVAEHGPVAVVSGWIPVTRLDELMALVSNERDTELFDGMRRPGWGALVRDPAPDETPPTLIEPLRLFRPVKALFDGLGIAPGYTEADVSVPFLCYFSLFFAMLVGDGAYGAIFLALTLWGWRRYRAAPDQARSPRAKSWLVLMTVFSSATVAWGLLSNTWFGAPLPFAASWPTVAWLADPSYHNMMLLCFTIGVSHLMLARLWNGLCLLNDTRCVAEFGWAGVLLFMYLVTNFIVGIFPSVPGWGFWTFAVSLVAVFGFSVKPSELKTRGAELGMLPLNVMSALGDIISYVRLFAVGLASVKVAENFNGMACGLLGASDSLWIKPLLALAMVAILLVGHALNIAMAGLSILVHAVRLNTLEFSNHKGISWSGHRFHPFARESAHSQL